MIKDACEGLTIDWGGANAGKLWKQTKNNNYKVYIKNHLQLCWLPRVI